MKWPKVKLDSIKADLRYAFIGGPFGSNLTTRDYVEEGVPVIRGNNLPADRTFLDDDFVFVTEEKADKLQSNTAYPGDVIFTQRGTLGQVGIIPLEAKFSRYVISQSQMKLSVNPEKADARFVYYFFRMPSTVQSVINHVLTSGVPHINLGILKDFEIPLPHTTVQERIVDILFAYDELIENNRRRMALLEEAARLLYWEWFVRLRFPGHEHTIITDGVPEGWERKALGDICTDVRETVLPEELGSDTPYIGLEHMPRRSITLSEWGRAEDVTSTKHRFRTGEILFGKIRPYFHKVGIAFVNGVASSDAIVIRPVSQELRGLVLLTVSSDPFVAQASQTMREGSKMPRADWKLMKQYAIRFPHAGLLNSFNGIVESVTEQLKTLTFQTQKLRAARDLLLPRLMSGEMAV
jgi:type I restriction enzyme, S subunit